MVGPVQAVEQFHLVFLAQLVRRVSPSCVVVKDGCNLRFFHGSIRYSEDTDLDVAGIDAQAFRDKVRDVLAARPFTQILQARGVGIDRVSEPKQTETTQRWKLALGVEGASAPLPTKIECSRRGFDEGVAFGSVNAHIARVYQLPPLMLSHYDAASALRQKIGALAGRREVQARDVFDLHHLIAGGAAPAGGVAPSRTAAPERVSAPAGRLGLKPEVVERACANAMLVDFAMFKAQVLAYLEPDDQARFDSASVWDTIVLEVVEVLRGYSP